MKTGPGTFVNCNESGTYTYTVPVTLIREGGWDITLKTALQGCVIGFDGDNASQRLTFCYKSYSEDLVFNDGGIFETNGVANAGHGIDDNGKKRQIVFTGTPVFNPTVFSGTFYHAAGLRWSPSSADAVFVCSNAVSASTGAVTVEKGAVRLVNGASFTALSELAVAADAVFEVAAGAGAGFHADALTLGGPTARMTLGEGVALTVTSATLDGAAMPAATYSSDGAGRVTVETGPGNIAVWCGAADMSDMTQGANWEGGAVPDLVTGDLFVTFATGGAEARLFGTAGFDGIVLNAGFEGAQFTFAAGSGAAASLRGNGLTAAPVTWDWNWPVTLAADQTWTIGANNTMEVNAPVSGSSALTLAGTGTTHLNVTSPHTGGLTLDGGTFRTTASNAFGAGGRTVGYDHTAVKLVFGGTCAFDSAFWSSKQNESGDVFMMVEPGAHVTFNGSFGYLSNGGITFGAGSVTTFAGGLRFQRDGMKGMILPQGSGTVVVTNRILSECRAWEGQAGHPVTLELCVAGNCLADGSYWAKFPSGRLVTRVPGAIGFSYGHARFYFDDAEFDLDGNDQSVTLIAATANARVTSARPATLTITSGSDGDSQNGTYGGTNRIDRAVYSGCVNVTKGGVYPHAFGATSTTTGGVTVTQGVVTMTADGRWPNATAVNVVGGSLVVNNAEAFGPEAVWTVTPQTAPVVALDFTGILPCGKLRMSGTSQPGGVYGAVGSGAEHEVAWISGTGFLKVKVNVTTVIFR